MKQNSLVFLKLVAILTHLYIDVSCNEVGDAVNLTNELHDPYAQVNHLYKRRKKKT